MRNVEDILKQAEGLSPDERRRLVDSLEESLADEQTTGAEATRRAGLQRWLSHAGIGHSDFTDVSSDKYKHLAEVYADEK